MRNLSKVISAFVAATLATTASAESYLCVANNTTGFDPKGDTGKWVQRSFNSDFKYVISSVAPDDPQSQVYKNYGKLIGHMSPVNWVVRAIGKADVQAVCTTPDATAVLSGDDTAMTTVGAMRCRGVMSEYVFNLHALRFEVIFYGGVVTGGTDSTAIQIGECTPI